MEIIRNNQETNKPTWKQRNWVSISVIVALLAITGIWIWMGTGGIIDFKEHRFDALSALFSGWAFAGIIITILLQRKELILQRKELELTRTELKRSADAQSASENAFNRQAENLKMSAKLTALNTLVNYYTTKFEALNAITVEINGPGYQREIDIYIEQIKTILQAKE